MNFCVWKTKLKWKQELKLCQHLDSINKQTRKALLLFSASTDTRYLISGRKNQTYIYMVLSLILYMTMDKLTVLSLTFKFINDLEIKSQMIFFNKSPLKELALRKTMISSIASIIFCWLNKKHWTMSDSFLWQRIWYLRKRERHWLCDKILLALIRKCTL